MAKFLTLLTSSSLSTNGASTMRQPVGNRNVLAYTNSTSTSRVRSFRVNHWVAKNTGYGSVKLTYANWVASSTTELVSFPTLRIEASIYYQGTFYPVTFGGASYYHLAAGASIESDAVAGLSLTANTEFTECGCYFLPLLFKTQTVDFTVGQTVTGGTSGATGIIVSQTDAGTTGSLNLHTETGTFVANEALTDPLGGAAVVDLTTTQKILNGMATVDAWLEGVMNSNNSDLTYLASDPVTTRASYTATVSGGNITAGVKVNGGSGYSSGATAVATEYINGILWKKSVGYFIKVGSAQNSMIVTSGTPPSGLAAWVSPSITVAGGGDFGSTTSIQGAALITGIPSRAVKSVLLMGDSITRGFSSTDAIGDLYHNFGFHERAIANRCGVINMGISSLLASALADYAGTYPLSYALYMGKTTHVRGAIGINDITSSRTYAQLEANLNTIAAKVRTYGSKFAYATYTPSATSTDSYATEANQTPRTGCGAGGVKDLVNADILSGALVSDWQVCDINAYAHGTDPNKWDVSIAKTADGTHLSAYIGIAGAALDSTIVASYNEIA